MKRLPSWFSFHQLANMHKKTLMAMADVPFDWVKEQRAAGTAEHSFVSDLIDASEGTAQEEFNIKWAAASMYSGGADTTVGTMYTFFLCMTLYPEAQRKAQAEIDRVVGRSRLPDFEDRESLPYLDCVISEVLRYVNRPQRRPYHRC